MSVYSQFSALGGYFSKHLLEGSGARALEAIQAEDDAPGQWVGGRLVAAAGSWGLCAQRPRSGMLVLLLLQEALHQDPCLSSFVIIV